MDVLPASVEPIPWKVTDIGNTGFPGGARYDDENRLVMVAGGERFLGRSDDFHLVYQELEGDGSITLRLRELSPAGVGNGVGAVVGVMLRKSLEADSPYFAMSISRTRAADGALDGMPPCAGRNAPMADGPSGAFDFHRRFTRSTRFGGGDPVDDLANAWVSVERQGDEFIASTSTDGATWTVLDRRTLDLPRNIFAGIALTAGNTRNPSHAVRAVVEVEIDGVDPVVAFVRANCNGDGGVDISDAVCILNWLFAGAPEPGCLASLNANGDGEVNITDPVWLLSFLFAGGPAPMEPFPDCGPGMLPADTALGCANPPNC